MSNLNFSKQNLKGYSFRGQNLAQADFSKSDIRGCDFSGANLEGANFRDSISGLTHKQEVILVIIAVVLAFVAGFVAALAAGVFFIAFQKSLGQSALITVLSIASILALSTKRYGYIALASTLAVAIAIAGAGIGALIGANLGALTVALFLIVCGIGAVTGAGIYATIGNHSIWIAGLGTLFSAIALGIWMNAQLAGIMSVIAAGTVEILAGFVAHSAFTGSEKLAFVRQQALAFTTWGGTSFYRSNLANAKFDSAIIAKTDFRNAILTRASFKNVIGSEYCRFERTDLHSSAVREVCITGNGAGKNFDNLSLRGINWSGAILSDASFIGTNLNQSNLQGADLSKAVLKQTQLEGTALTGATLTGAYIEDWGITSTTQLEDVQCEYVFMRVPTKENPNPLRKPDNWKETFANGEFSDFIQPYFDTLDLYHSQDIDPRAISIALKNLSTNHPEEELEFIAMERRGRIGLNLRFATAPGANKSELSREYFADYARIKKELPIAVQLRLSEQDAEIRTLKGTIEQFIQTGTHQSTVHANTIQVIQGELVMTENKGINVNAGGNISNLSGLVSGDVSGVFNLGTISGSVTNAINQLPSQSISDQPSLKELLTQLQTLIETEEELKIEDKAEALEQVKTLAEAGQKPEDSGLKKAAKTAMKILKGTISGLSETTKLVGDCTKLLPAITALLALV